MKKIIAFSSTLLLIITASCSNVAEIPTSDDGGITNTISSKDASSAAEDDIVLVYATKGDLTIEEQKLIDSFNEEDNGYFVETRDYSNYMELDESVSGVLPEGEGVYKKESISAMQIQLAQDVIKGNIDIVSDRTIGLQRFDTFINLDGFADLYPFMENDQEINKTTLNSNVLSLHESNGKLCQLPSFFSIDTLLGPSEFVGEQENWSVDDFIDCWNKMPVGSTIDGKTTKEYVYFILLRQQLSSFVSYIDGRVAFDSPEFIRLLEFCNSFDGTSDYLGERDWKSASMVSHVILHGFNDYHLRNWNEKNEKYTYVGYPSSNGKGAILSTAGNRMAICANSPADKQLGAWMFIKKYVSKDYQSQHYIEYDEKHDVYGEERGFPVNNIVYQEMASKAIEGRFSDSSQSFNGTQKEVGYLTEEELNRLNKYVDSVGTLYTSIDDSLKEIVEEEVFAYFNGEKTADEAAAIIQNRAELLVSERT